MAVLTGTTVVANRHGMPVLLREGDPLPEWAIGKVGAHLLREDAPATPTDPDAAPPKAGAGSGKAAWAAYADRLGVEFDPDDGRDDIIAAVEAAQQA